MKRIAPLVAAGLLTLTGCYTVHADLPGTLRSDVAETDVEKVGQFDVQKGNNFLLWGLVGAPPADFISQELAREVKAKNGDGVRNFEYHSEFGCVDLLLTSVTCGIFSPKTFHFKGDVVRIRKPALSGGAQAGAGASTTPTSDAPPPPALSY
jgi:hypothetical protein